MEAINPYIYVIEDEESISKLICLYLSKSEMTPKAFYNAEDALENIKKDIESIYSVFGDRRAVAVKEITKIHENVEQFNLKDGTKGEPKGEYVLVIEKAEESNPLNGLSEEEHIKHYLELGMSKMEALKMVAKERGVSKSSLYKYTIKD